MRLHLLLLLLQVVACVASANSVAPAEVITEVPSTGRQSRGFLKSRSPPTVSEPPSVKAMTKRGLFKGKRSLAQPETTGRKRLSLPSFSQMGTSISTKVTPVIDKCLEGTIYSKENQPESERHAEWTGFLSGWMVVAVPVPLPITVAVIAMNIFILLKSKWADDVKNKYLIGYCHGAMVLLVLLRTLEASPKYQGQPLTPRVAMMGLNLATSLVFGHAGSYVITKRLMDTAVSLTLLYLLVHYLR